jgi:hypothetical protein
MESSHHEIPHSMLQGFIVTRQQVYAFFRKRQGNMILSLWRLVVSFRGKYKYVKSIHKDPIFEASNHIVVIVRLEIIISLY